jgi:ElaB/YqjD/DUF883 family membrane-anchored ribosome-binding protein
MSQAKNGPPPEAQLERAQMEVEQAKRRFASTAGALRYRLRPGTLVNNAWDGVREKGGEVADGAIQAVKERPVTTSGVVAAVLIFLGRDQLWRFASGLFSGRAEAEDSDVIRADLETHDQDYDLTAPTVIRSINEGVNV